MGLGLWGAADSRLGKEQSFFHNLQVYLEQEAQKDLWLLNFAVTNRNLPPALNSNMQKWSTLKVLETRVI